MRNLEGICGIRIRAWIFGVGKESDMEMVKKSRYFLLFSLVLMKNEAVRNKI